MLYSVRTMPPAATYALRTAALKVAPPERVTRMARVVASGVQLLTTLSVSPAGMNVATFFDDEPQTITFSRPSEMHDPLAQALSASQVSPQPPQLFGSKRGSTHAPAQTISGDAHEFGRSCLTPIKGG